DFAQLRAAGFKNFGNAKSAADLDQLAARNDDFLAFAGSEMPKDEHQGRGAVVDDRRRFRAADEGQVVFEISGAAAPHAAGQIEFEIVVVGGNGLKHLDYGESERRAAQVGVDDDAGAVDHRLDTRVAEGVERRADAREHAVEVGNIFFFA